MKLDNFVLLAVGTLLAWMGWVAFGPDSPPPVISGGSSPEFRAALASGQTVLVDFYADWCPPCRAMKPAVHELADDLRGKLEVVQINVDQNHDLAHQYGASSIPCFVVIKGGKEVARRIGGMPKQALRQLTGL